LRFCFFSPKSIRRYELLPFVFSPFLPAALERFSGHFPNIFLFFRDNLIFFFAKLAFRLGFEGLTGLGAFYFHPRPLRVHSDPLSNPDGNSLWRTVNLFAFAAGGALYLLFALW